MRVNDLLIDLAGRSATACRAALAGLPAERANTAPEPGANPITWLVWHAVREQDSQVAALAGRDEVWVTGGWFERFGLDLPPASDGYGHTPQQVAAVVVDDVDLLRGYLSDVAAAVRDYLGTLDEASLDEVVDTHWTPHVTRGVRLISIFDDACQHAGQAAYVRGLLDRRRNT